MKISPQEIPPHRMCPLCRSAQTKRFLQDDTREYRRCPDCALTFVPAAFHLSSEDEYARYQTHQNNPNDVKYRAFLNRLVRHLVSELPPAAKGLDYGSGPGPTLSVMLEEQGFAMRNYDPYFTSDPSVFRETYDFITCTETIEHFTYPGHEFETFQRLLRSDGRLGVMTQILENDAMFPGWWYRNDPTHICFYRPETMQWIATRFNWQLTFPAANVAIFRVTTRETNHPRNDGSCRRPQRCGPLAGSGFHGGNIALQGLLEINFAGELIAR